jgi:hypothetical protein
VDRLRAFVLIYHAKVERERMSLKLRGVTASLAKLHHNLDLHAEKLESRIVDAQARGDAVFAQARDLADVDKLLSDLEQSNGGPTLDDSAESSGKPHLSL